MWSLCKMNFLTKWHRPDAGAWRSMGQRERLLFAEKNGDNSDGLTESPRISINAAPNRLVRDLFSEPSAGGAGTDPAWNHDVILP